MSVVVTCDHAGCGKQAESLHWCSPEEMTDGRVIRVQFPVTLPPDWATYDAKPEFLVFCPEHADQAEADE